MDWHELRDVAIDHLPHELDDDLLRDQLPNAEHAAHFGPVSSAHNVEWLRVDKVILDESSTLRVYGDRMVTRFELRFDGYEGWVWEQGATRQHGRRVQTVRNASIESATTWESATADLPGVLSVDCGYFTCDELAAAEINPRDKWRVLVEAA